MPSLLNLSIRMAAAPSSSRTSSCSSWSDFPASSSSSPSASTAGSPSTRSVGLGLTPEMGQVSQKAKNFLRSIPPDLRPNGAHLPRPGLRHVGLQLHERRLLRRHPRMVHLLPRRRIHHRTPMGRMISLMTISIFLHFLLSFLFGKLQIVKKCSFLPLGGPARMTTTHTTATASRTKQNVIKNITRRGTPQPSTTSELFYFVNLGIEWKVVQKIVSQTKLHRASRLLH